MSLLLLLALQAAPVPPERFSILAPTPTAPCRPRLPSDDIVVCATNEADQRLPLPAERGPPDRPMPSNPKLDGGGALAATGNPCATLQGGCQTGVDIFGAGTAAIRLLGKLVSPDSCCENEGDGTNPAALAGDMVGGVKRLFAKKPDKSNRVPIALD